MRKNLHCNLLFAMVTYIQLYLICRCSHLGNTIISQLFVIGQLEHFYPTKASWIRNPSDACTTCNIGSGAELGFSPSSVLPWKYKT
jgi:hypothetical protein